MPASYRILEEQSLIVIEWHGAASDEGLIDTYKHYIKNIRSKYPDFSEIVDMRNAEAMKVSINGLIDLGGMAAKADNGKREQKMALVIQPGKAFTLARAYIFYRNMCRSNCKRIETFQQLEDAVNWISAPGY